MAVRIGHASIDESRKAKGGSAGDQTGKEVCIRSWYNGSWEFAARAKDAAVAERIASAAEAGCDNPNIGYDQNQRNTLNRQAKAAGYDLSKIKVPCETDCSAFVSVCVQAAGVDVPYSSGNAPTTRTLKKVLSSTGAFEILTDSRYLTSEKYLKRGDILCRAGHHTAMVLDDGESAGAVTVPVAAYPVQLPVLKKGSRGESVRALQILLIGFGYSCGSSAVDGSFGPATQNAVECFQEDNGLEADGKCGPKTWAKLLGM